jgi:hypothetical protein
MASPKASTDKDGAKKGMKIATVSQAMKNIMVGRHPKRSCAHMLIQRPAS